MRFTSLLIAAATFTIGAFAIENADARGMHGSGFSPPSFSHRGTNFPAPALRPGPHYGSVGTHPGNPRVLGPQGPRENGRWTRPCNKSGGTAPYHIRRTSQVVQRHLPGRVATCRL